MSAERSSFPPQPNFAAKGVSCDFFKPPTSEDQYG